MRGTKMIKNIVRNVHTIFSKQAANELGNIQQISIFNLNIGQTNGKNVEN